MRCGTHRDLLFWSKSRCFAFKNHRWGMGPIEARNSGANYAVFHAQNDRWCLGPIEICYSGTKVAVFHAKTTDEGWDPSRLVFLTLGTLFCMQKMTGEVWDPERLVIFWFKTHCFSWKNHRWGLEPIQSFYSCAKHAVMGAQTTDEVWDSYKLVSLDLKSLFYMQKPQMKAGTCRD